MANENVLVMVPVFLALVLILGLSAMTSRSLTSSKSPVVTSLIQMEPPKSPDGLLPGTPGTLPFPPTGGATPTKDDSTCASCPSSTTAMKCTDSSSPVLGGVDVVNYFTAFKLADGSYDETQVGVAGTTKYSSTYMGYTFYFVSAENKKLFDGSPAKYAPQYGGFCSWGMSTEFCPKSPWSSDCLGPYGNWAHWTIQNEKLYFFWFGDAKENFKSNDINTLLSTADQRWAGWYGESSTSKASTGVFSTNCYSSEALPDDSSLHPK